MGEGGFAQGATGVVQTLETHVPGSEQRVRRHSGVLRKVSFFDGPNPSENIFQKKGRTLKEPRADRTSPTRSAIRPDPKSRWDMISDRKFTTN